MMRRRNDIDICADILEVSKGGAKKTHIVYEANLNFNIAKKYLHRLIENDLLSKKGGRQFETTEKGFEFIEQYRKIVAPLKF